MIEEPGKSIRLKRLGSLDKKHLFVAAGTLSKSVDTGKVKASEHATDVTNEDSETDF